MVWRKRYSYDPFEEMMREIEEMMTRVFREFEPLTMGTERVEEPLVDIFEKDGRVIIDVELPGVDKKDIKVKFLDNKTLLVEAERKSLQKYDDEHVVKRETYVEKFRRVIKLPGKVKIETTKAKYNNGLLEITVELQDNEKKKEIEVKVE